MDIIKFILVTGLIVVITCIIPMFLFNEAIDISSIVKPVEDSGFYGVAGYGLKIVSDPNATPEIKENVSNITKIYTDTLNYKNVTFGRYSSYLFAISGIILIIFGITISKLTDKKFISSCLIAAGIITICFCVYGFITIMTLH